MTDTNLDEFLQRMISDIQLKPKLTESEANEMVRKALAVVGLQQEAKKPKRVGGKRVPRSRTIPADEVDVVFYSKWPAILSEEELAAHEYYEDDDGHPLSSQCPNCQKNVAWQLFKIRSNIYRCPACGWMAPIFTDKRCGDLCVGGVCPIKIHVPTALVSWMGRHYYETHPVPAANKNTYYPESFLVETNMNHVVKL